MDSTGNEAYYNTVATRSLGYRRAQLQKLHDALVAHEPALLAGGRELRRKE